MKIFAPIFLPVLALAAWSMVMWVWMFLTRIPAVLKVKMKFDPNTIRGEQMSTLPPRVRWKADNYHNLFEQPTIFYPVAIVLGLIGHSDGLNLQLAWAYVLLRVIHSLVQALWNNVEVRFAVFILSGIPLLLMIMNGIRALS